MKISEIFESPSPVGIIPGAKMGEIKPGERPSGTYELPITQAGPDTSNTPETDSPTGFTPGAKVVTPQPGSDQTGGTQQTTQTPQTSQQGASANLDGVQNDLRDLKRTLMRMQTLVTSPPPPPN